MVTQRPHNQNIRDFHRFCDNLHPAKLNAKAFGVEHPLNQSESDQIKSLEAAARFPDMNPGPVLQVNQDGKILLANRAARSAFGDSIATQSWLEICKGLDQRAWEGIVKTGQPESREAHINGLDFVFNYRVDQLTGVVFVFGSDITELKEAQRTPHEVARFPDMNPGPVLRLDPSASVLMSNKAALGMFGSELNGRRWLDICPGLTDAAWNKLLKSEELLTVEGRINDRDYLFTHRCDHVSQLVFVYGTDVTEQRALEEELRQAEKMAALGKMSAGLAHELNNPAAAAGRAADQIKESVDALQAATVDLARSGARPEDWDNIAKWESGLISGERQSGHQLSALELGDREEELMSWLEQIDFPVPWEAASVLATAGITVTDLRALENSVPPDLLNPVLVRTCRAMTVNDLADVLSRSARSISNLVGAVKSYSYMDRAPVQNADIHQGLEDTITILWHKLKNGITLIREYDRTIPMLQINGSELNQVWTNLIDNAVDAMEQKGTLTIRTSQTKDNVIVEIGDSGPGIDPSVQGKILQPFFTTKEVGKGTGLGLDIARRIVTDRSRGKLSFTSRPGETIFKIELPRVQATPKPAAQ